jgi:hypothetical protein
MLFCANRIHGPVIARDVIGHLDTAAHRATPWGDLETPLIFQISPPSVTTYAVFLMNSSEVGWLRRSVTTVKVPCRLTFTREPVFGNAGEPAGPPDPSDAR